MAVDDAHNVPIIVKYLFSLLVHEKCDIAVLMPKVYVTVNIKEKGREITRGKCNIIIVSTFQYKLRIKWDHQV